MRPRVFPGYPMSEHAQASAAQGAPPGPAADPVNEMVRNRLLRWGATYRVDILRGEQPEVTSVQREDVYVVYLWSQYETRTLEWKYTPYSGGPRPQPTIDPETGADPWNLAVPYPDDLEPDADWSRQFEVNGTHHVDECRRCDGDGWVWCDRCGGDGRVECGRCGGRGLVSCPAWGCDDGWVRCGSCGGSGRGEDGACTRCGGRGGRPCGECRGRGSVRCEPCGGSGWVDCRCNHGKVTCGRCRGSGELVWFQVLTVRITAVGARSAALPDGLAVPPPAAEWHISVESRVLCPRCHRECNPTACPQCGKDFKAFIRATLQPEEQAGLIRHEVTGSHRDVAGALLRLHPRAQRKAFQLLRRAAAPEGSRLYRRTLRVTEVPAWRVGFRIRSKEYSAWLYAYDLKLFLPVALLLDLAREQLQLAREAYARHDLVAARAHAQVAARLAYVPGVVPLQLKVELRLWLPYALGALAGGLPWGALVWSLVATSVLAMGAVALLLLSYGLMLAVYPRRPRWPFLWGALLGAALGGLAWAAYRL